MASPAWLPHEVQSSGTPVGGLSRGLLTASATASETSGVVAPVSEGTMNSGNDSAKESPREKFVNAPSYAVSAPSFTYNVSSGSSHLSLSNLAINSNAPGPPVIIQPSSVGFPGNQMIQSAVDASTAVSEASGLSTASAVSQSISLPLISHSNSTLIITSSPNFGPSASQTLSTSSLPVPPGLPGTPRIPAPAGLMPSAIMSLPSAGVDFTSSLVQRPPMPAVSTLNPLGQQQAYPSYPSLPSMAATPQGIWLPPPQMGGVTRPPFLPYPAVFPGPFPSPAHSNPRPVSFPDSHPPGVTPVGPAGPIPISSVASGNQSIGTSGMQTQLPPGIDNRSHPQNIVSKGEATIIEASDTWTVHKTDTGAVYYYNAITGVSTYEKPPAFKGELEKVPVQPTPVSMENLAGTDWALITTNDGRKYYYNNKTKSSSWQIPSEVTELRKKQETDLLKEHATSMSNVNVSAEKEFVPITLSAPAVNTGGRDAAPLRVPSTLGACSALDLIKKKLQDSGVPVASSPVPVTSGIAASEPNGSKTAEAASKGLPSENSKDKLKDSNEDGNASDSSSDSEDEENAPTKEECIIQFKEMLKERGVAPFSKWEKELPKILFDPRFTAIPSQSARRALFERYVKTRAEEERKEKRAAQKAAIEGFKQLLEEASEDIDQNTDYQNFRKKWGSDPRFETLDRREREHLLNERVHSIKKAAQEKAEADRAAAAASFKSMLRRRGDITVNSHWSKVKDSLRSDPRYKSVKHEDREVLFEQYLSELRAAEEETELATKPKREEDKLKERERELRKRKEREEQEMEKVRVKVRRKEAVASFQALLVETIKDPQAFWTESKPKLEKDPQRRATNPDLDPSEMEKLFRDHIKMLHERCTLEFKALLAENITAEAASQKTEDGKTVLDSWSTAKRLLKPDPRYNKMPRKEREALWRRHAEEILRKQTSMLDQREDKHGDVKARSNTDSGKYLPVSRSTHSRR